MKTILALVCALNLVGAFFALVAGPIFVAACLGGALIAGVGYGILDRLDRIIELGQPTESIRKLLLEIRDKDVKRDPAIDDPARRVDVDAALDAMLATRGLASKK